MKELFLRPISNWLLINIFSSCLLYWLSIEPNFGATISSLADSGVLYKGDSVAAAAIIISYPRYYIGRWGCTNSWFTSTTSCVLSSSLDGASSS